MHPYTVIISPDAEAPSLTIFIEASSVSIGVAIVGYAKMLVPENWLGKYQGS